MENMDALVKTINIPVQLKNGTFVLLHEGQKKCFTDKQNTTWQTHSAEDRELMEWRGNLGFLCGSDGIQVLDLDRKNNPYFEELREKLDAFETFTVKTANDGRHYYFVSPEQHPQAYSVLKYNGSGCGEYRASKSYVVAPGSVVDGKEYQIINGGAIKTVPVKDILSIFNTDTKQQAIQTSETPNTDKSRSGFEFGELCKLQQKALQERGSVLSFEEINEKMKYFSKWAEENPSYKKITYDKASEKIKQTVKKDFSNDLDSEICNALSKPRQPHQGIGAGIHNETLYYGTSIPIGEKSASAIITSDKKIYIDAGKRGNQIKDKFGLNYRYSFFEGIIKYDWSHESIQEFLYGTPTDIGIKSSFDLILTQQKKYMWHPKEGYHELIACDILSTYFLPLFASKGRSFFNAEKASGKTQQMNLYAGLAFHPLFSGNISGASTYRVIESIKPTVLVDDYDKIPDEQKTSFDQIVRTGYKKGAKAIRTDDLTPIGFDLYSSMVINNIYGMDEVSESRCSKHILESAPDWFKAKDIENEIDQWQKTRDLLYTCGLLHWKEVKTIYETLEIPELYGRERERDIATLTIAKMCGCLDIVYKYIKEMNSERRTQSLDEDFEFLLLDWLNKKVQAGEEKTCTLQAKEMAEGIAPEYLDMQEGSPLFIKEAQKLAKKIGHYFKRKSNTIKPKMVHGRKLYVITETILKRLAEIKGCSEELFGKSQEVQQTLAISPPMGVIGGVGGEGVTAIDGCSPSNTSLDSTQCEEKNI